MTVDAMKCLRQLFGGSYSRFAGGAARGAVLVITLIALMLLAALMFFVINLGHQVNSKVVTQNSADASAIAGAGWIARSLNTVATNNIAIARLLSTVAVLDSMPKASKYSLIDQAELRDMLDSQLQQTIPDPWITDALTVMRDEAAIEVTKLAPISELYNDSDYDVRVETYFTAPDEAGGAMGTAWQAMYALDEYSQAVMVDIGQLTQVNAIRGGEVNLVRANDRTAFMVPFTPDLPWKRGRFSDFNRPVRQGLLPAAEDDPRIRRGPWDAVFGFRHAAREGGTTTSIGQGKVPIGSKVSTSTMGKVIGYKPFGDYTWAIAQMGSIRLAEMPHSRFAYTGRHRLSRPVGSTPYWVNHLAKIKLNYLWGESGSAPVDVIEPRWINDFPTAASMADDEDHTIYQTRFVAIEIKSKYERSSPMFMTEGTWMYVVSEQDVNPRVIYAGGWTDPRTWGVDRIASYIWRDEWDYPVPEDPEIGINTQFDEDGILIMQTVYRIDSFMFAGVNIGSSRQVGNPYNITDSPDQLPAPIILDHSQVQPSEGSKREYLTYFAVVSQDDTAPIWPSKFKGGKPYGQIVSIAQARVFNDHSWDLWTPMWQSKLMAVTGYRDWLHQMQDTLGEVDSYPMLDSAKVERTLNYLRSLEDLSDIMLTH